MTAARLASELEAGQVAAIPTETVWGLVARLDRPDAIARIFALKGRDPSKPLQVLVESVDDIESVAHINLAAERVMDLLPGPLTLILEAVEGLPDLGSSDSTVGIRVPDHEAVQELLALTGPLAATSANLSGRKPCTTAQEVRSVFADQVVYPDAGEAGGTMASTVLDLAHGHPRLIRAGAVGHDEIEKALGETIRREW